eukprot:GHRR01012381.1.p1 GENE.GHRR01012381.1~~GHRR01012381.1.p1  ORF type:complete len:507 (+),score=181.90 GHRR01012381.1:331-1851(+)
MHSSTQLHNMQAHPIITSKSQEFVAGLAHCKPMYSNLLTIAYVAALVKTSIHTSFPLVIMHEWRLLPMQRAMEALQEAEKVKLVLNTKGITPKLQTLRRPANTVQITDANTLPDIDWEGAAAPPPAAAAAAAAGIPVTGTALTPDLEWPPRSSSITAAPGDSAAVTSTSSQQWEPVAYSSHYTPSSQQTVQKHALFASRSGSRPLQQQASSSRAARYPSFDTTPIDALWAQSKSSPDAAAAAIAADVSRLSVSSNNSQQQQNGSYIDAAPLPRPSAGPSLGPQEVEVQRMQSCGADADGSCAVAPVGLPSIAEAAAATAAGPKSLSKLMELRDVHISVALMNDFLHYAANNTRRGIESCGILAGRLSAVDSRFTVTTLIVPKQTGTSDTVEMLSEEEVWEVESSRELVPLGWIHTHPTQTCFLSSVDIHTQCGYQTMLEEAVAIVMAPTDSKQRCGIFRLATPAGLEHVQRCPYKGFHSQCNSSVYELSGHVYLSPGVKHEVVDLR